MEKTMMPSYGQSGTSQMKFHHGSVLKRLGATYPTVEAVILEAIQNAIDENPTTIWVSIDLKSRIIEVADDGKGASVQEFEEEALGSIAYSTKSNGKMGRYGLGFIGGFSICERYTFTAAPKRDTQKYMEWTFDSKILESLKDEPDIPYRERLDLRYSRKMAGLCDDLIMFVPWRAAIKFMNISRDKIISRMSPDTLEGEILARYGVPMRKRNIAVLLKFIDINGQEIAREIRGRDFQGTPLGHVIIHPPHTNEYAEFRLYLAPVTIKGRRGVIHFGELGSEYRISDKEFTMPVIGLMDEDVISALRSGIFEGEILSSCAKGNANRHSFNQDENLEAFCLAIVEWYRLHGEQHVTEIRESNKEHRYQKLGIRALDELQSLLRDVRYRELIPRLTSSIGNIGVNHAPPKKVVGEMDQNGVATQGRRRNSNRNDSGNHQRPPASEEDPNHHPLVAMGPAGRKRLEVKNSSIGLTIVHSEMVDSSEPYEFIPEKGMLAFNTRHPWFVQCDRTDAKFVKYQCAVVLHALTLNAQPSDWQEVQRLALHQLLELEVFQIAR